MKIVKGKVLYGTMDDNGIFTQNVNATSINTASSNDDVFIMVDPKGKKNNTNLVKIPRATWLGNVSVEKNVGTVSEPNEETST